MNGNPGIDFEKCKACYLCITVCPKSIFDIGLNSNKTGYNPVQVANPQYCTGCPKLCWRICPDSAIELEVSS